MAYLEYLISGFKIYIRGKGFLVALASGTILSVYTIALKNPYVNYIILALTFTSITSAVLIDNLMIKNVLKGLEIAGAPPSFIRRILLCYSLLLALTLSTPLVVTIAPKFKCIIPLLTFLLAYILVILLYRRTGRKG